MAFVKKEIENMRSDAALQNVVSNLATVATLSNMQTGSVPQRPVGSGADAWVYDEGTSEWVFRQWFKAGDVCGVNPVRPN